MTCVGSMAACWMYATEEGADEAAGRGAAAAGLKGKMAKVWAMVTKVESYSPPLCVHMSPPSFPSIRCILGRAPATCIRAGPLHPAHGAVPCIAPMRVRAGSTIDNEDNASDCETVLIVPTLLTRLATGTTLDVCRANGRANGRAHPVGCVPPGIR